MVSICFRALTFVVVVVVDALSGRLFVRNRVRVRSLSGRFFCHGIFFLAWFIAIEDLLLGPRNATFMMLNQQTTKSIMVANRRRNKASAPSDLFYLCGFTTLASAQFFPSPPDEKTFSVIRCHNFFVIVDKYTLLSVRVNVRVYNNMLHHAHTHIQKQ